MATNNGRLQYGSPIWANSTYKFNACREALLGPSVLRIMCCYRTVSREAALLLAGTPPNTHWNSVQRQIRPPCQGQTNQHVIVNTTLCPQNPTKLFIVYINSSSRELMYCIALEENIYTWYAFDFMSPYIFYFVNYL